MAGMDNATKWTAGGLDAIHVAYRGSGGSMSGFANLSASSTVNTGSGMRRLVGAQTAPFALKEPVVKTIPGDNGVLDTFTWASADVNQGILELGENDGTFDVAADGVTVKTVGVYTFFPRGGTVANPGNFMFLLTRDAHGQDSATSGQSGWENELVMYTRVKPLGDEDRAHQKEGKARQQVTFIDSTVTPWGETCTAAFGVYQRQSFVWTSTYRSMFHCWVSDGSAAATTALDYTPISAATTKAWNFTLGTALTVSSVNTTTKIPTLSAVPLINNLIVMLYQTASF